MTRDAKLYFLKYKNWQHLADIFVNHSDNTLKDDVTIFQLMGQASTGEHYAILSLSDKADKIIEDYGATLADETNYTRNALHDYRGEPLFGDKSNLTFLNKIP